MANRFAGERTSSPENRGKTGAKNLNGGVDPSVGEATQFKPGDSAKSLGLDGTETFDISGISDDLQPRQELTVRASKTDGSTVTFKAIARADSPVDIDYLKHGGVLNMVLRNLVTS